MEELINKYRIQFLSGAKKSDVARSIAKANLKLSRKDFLRLLMESLEQKEVTASTYYGKYIKPVKINHTINEKNIITPIRVPEKLKSKEEHYEYFLRCITNIEPESWRGNNIKDYAIYLSNMGVQLDIECFPNRRLNREQLFEYISNTSQSVFNCTITILAWGGMNREHCINAIKSFNLWHNILEKIRNGQLNRIDAYADFHDLRSKNKLKGMGPAYYTKLIFFLSQEKNRGFIMDQWTSRSFNLLHNSPMIKVNIQKNKNGNFAAHVSDKNTPSTYEEFCSYIEKVSKSLPEKVKPDVVEMNMFSQGYGKGKWRTYLLSEDATVYQKS